VLWYGIKIWTDLSSVLSGITHVTDGQTDGRTDRQTEFSSLYHVCIICSAVITEQHKSLLTFTQPTFNSLNLLTHIIKNSNTDLTDIGSAVLSLHKVSNLPFSST